MKKKLIVTLLAVLALGACSEQDVNENQRQDGQQITFAPTVATDWNGAVTRAAMQQNATAKVQQLTDGLYLHTVTTPGFESDRQTENVTRGTLVNNVAGLGGHFGVSGYSYNGTASSSATADFLYKADVALVNNNWTTNQHFIWPQNEHIDFYGYAPYNDEKVAVADATTTGPMQIAFTVAADTAAQVDLMTAVSEPWQHLTDNQNVVPLTFKHQLTAIQFAIDKNIIPGVLEKIAFENISMAGTLTVGDTYNESTSWALSAKTDYELDFTAGNTKAGISLTNNNAINTNVVIIATPLLMIPQAFADGNSRLVVTIREGQETYDLSASLAETKWLPGTTVTYKISTSSVNVLRISGVTYPTSWNAASNELNTIKSSYSSTDGDALGLYAIDANGAVVKENERLAKTSTGWADNILFVPDLTYFAYYPYREDGLAHSGTKVVSNTAVAVTTAEEFFATGISSWTPKEDQNTAAELNAQDLQIGIGVLESASTLSFSMAHAMGLTSLTLETKQAATTRYFLINNINAESSGSYHDVGTTQLVAAHDFALYDNMLKKDATHLYYVVKPGSYPTVTRTATDLSKWATSSITLEASANVFAPFTAACAREYLYKGWAYDCFETGLHLTIPKEGDYTIECWGAEGGTGYSNYLDPSAQTIEVQKTLTPTPCPGGKGGYVSGVVHLPQHLVLYIYVGKKGNDARNTTQPNSGVLGTVAGGYNGGGSGQEWMNGGNGLTHNGAGGGGATHVSLQNALLANCSISNVLMVAGAGGGGGGHNYDDPGADAGGINGYDVVNPHYDGFEHAKGGTQTAGGGYTGNPYTVPYPGTFGAGGNCASSGGGGGGGAGYYGGGGGSWNGGGGGSSFINGHSGCNTEGTNTTYVFTSTVMLDGKSTAIVHPTTDATEIGHSGNGYCRIKCNYLE